MKKLKFISVLCLAVVFTLSSLFLFARGADREQPTEEKEMQPAPEKEAPPAPEKKDLRGVQLHVSMIDEEREWAFRDLLPEFEAKTGIKVTIDTYGFEDLFKKNLTAAAAHTGEYDVIQMHFPDMALFDERGYCRDITDFVMRDKDEIQLDDIHPSLQDSHMKYKGRFYGVPTHVGSMTFYYRKDIFEEQGYQVPKTWEDVLKIAKDVDQKYGPKIRGFAFMGRADIQGAATYLNFMGAYGGEFYDPNTYRPMFDTPEALKGMQTLKELVQYSVEGSPSYGFDEAHVAFQQGRAAMLPFWDSGDGFFSDPEQSDIIGKWWVAPMPGGRATNGGWSVQISADSENPEAAWEFLKWIISPDMERRLVPMKPSCRISILTDPAFKKYPSYQGFYNVLAGKPFPFPKILPNWQMLQLLGQAENEVVTGQKTPKEALTWLQDQYEVIMLRYNLWTPKK
jgi:multiple sugar transport system substrate-binding protein